MTSRRPMGFGILLYMFSFCFEIHVLSRMSQFAQLNYCYTPLRVNLTFTRRARDTAEQNHPFTDLKFQLYLTHLCTVANIIFFLERMTVNWEMHGVKVATVHTIKESYRGSAENLYYIHLVMVWYSATVFLCCIFNNDDV